MATYTAEVINSFVDGLKELMTASATALGLGPDAKVWEWDEHPAIPAERGELPVAYIIPLAEDGDKIDLLMGSEHGKHEFSITVVAYYRGSDAGRDAVKTDLRTVREYAYAFRDMFRYGNDFFGKDSSVKAQAKHLKFDFGYWVPPGGTPVVHFWTCKVVCTAII